MKSYAVCLSNKYIADLFPIGLSTNLTEAKVYSRLGSARSLKTKYSKQLINEFNKYSVKPIYLPFPKIEEFESVSKGYIK